MQKRSDRTQRTTHSEAIRRLLVERARRHGTASGRPPMDAGEFGYLRGVVPDERVGRQVEERLRNLGLDQ